MPRKAKYEGFCLEYLKEKKIGLIWLLKMTRVQANKLNSWTLTLSSKNKDLILKVQTKRHLLTKSSLTSTYKNWDCLSSQSWPSKDSKERNKIWLRTDMVLQVINKAPTKMSSMSSKECQHPNKHLLAQCSKLSRDNLK